MDAAGVTAGSGGPDVRILADSEALAREAAAAYIELARGAVADHGMFRVALSGGSTPRTLYEVLADRPYADEAPWQSTQVFFSDERFVPPDSEESNYHTAHVALLSKVPVPERYVHQVPTVDVSPEESASLYEEAIRRVFASGLAEVPAFDLVLLGLGPDGHTASLFPETQALTVSDHLVAANFVPTMDSWRVTFTYPLINAAAVVMFLVQGAEKAERVQEVLSGAQDLPAARVRPRTGKVIWFLDAAAAARYTANDAGSRG